MDNHGSRWYVREVEDGAIPSLLVSGRGGMFCCFRRNGVDMEGRMASHRPSPPRQCSVSRSYAVTATRRKGKRLRRAALILGALRRYVILCPTLCDFMEEWLEAGVSLSVAGPSAAFN